jgi:uncharacterized UBP type Zn finger protein
MKEVKIEAYSDICDYCYYRYISDAILQARMCIKCGSEYEEYTSFKGIKCIKLIEEKEEIEEEEENKTIELKELLEEPIEEEIEEEIEEPITELIKLTKEELIAFIIQSNTTTGIKEYVAMRAEINNIKKEEE